MTLKELSRLYHLKREIESDIERLEELRARARSPSASRITGLPRTPAMDSRSERYIDETVDLSAIIFAKHQQCLYERNKLERYISGIGDSLTRQIFTLRFINGLPWPQVAASIDKGLTDAYVRNACYAHLKKIRKRLDKDAGTC